MDPPERHMFGMNTGAPPFSVLNRIPGAHLQHRHTEVPGMVPNPATNHDNAHYNTRAPMHGASLHPISQLHAYPRGPNFATFTSSAQLSLFPQQVGWGETAAFCMRQQPAGVSSSLDCRPFPFSYPPTPDSQGVFNMHAQQQSLPSSMHSNNAPPSAPPQPNRRESGSISKVGDSVQEAGQSAPRKQAKNPAKSRSTPAPKVSEAASTRTGRPLKHAPSETLPRAYVFDFWSHHPEKKMHTGTEQKPLDWRKLNLPPVFDAVAWYMLMFGVFIVGLSAPNPATMEIT